uniref:UDENN FLCN/SMCR8-type domain-containing protein n=1 Tax=Globodera rostochiensis TaxID=31243 RepID=A0A914HB09_GLORO
MEEFLTFGRTIADPWRRVGCLSEPILLVVEFCQVQGPRPLYWFPEECTVNAHLLEEIAVWLMSSENVHANMCSMFNQQLAVHLLVQYGTMLDIAARAFQRPFAISLLMPSQPTAKEIDAFQRIVAELLVPILACNRRYVHSILRQAMLMLSECDQKNVQSYYSTSGNAQKIVIVSNKLKSVVHQTRAWYERVTEQLCGGENDGASEECFCECLGLDEFRRFVVPLTQKQSSCELLGLMDLAPCKGVKLRQSVQEAYRRLTGTEVAKGLMFCGSTAVLRSTFGANSELKDDDNGDDKAEEGLPVIVGRENTLRTLSFRLLRCVYPLLIGIDLLNKLNSLRICRRAEKVKWNFGENSTCLASLFDRNDKLFGVSCEANAALHLMDSAECKNCVVIDLCNHKMRGREYFGRFLAQLSGKRNFPSDSAVVAFVASIVTDVHQLLTLARYITPDAVINHLNLTVSDQLILLNCMAEFNVIKYSQMDKKKLGKRINLPYKKMKF